MEHPLVDHLPRPRPLRHPLHAVRARAVGQGDAGAGCDRGRRLRRADVLGPRLTGPGRLQLLVVQPGEHPQRERPLPRHRVHDPRAVGLRIRRTSRRRDREPEAEPAARDRRLDDHRRALLHVRELGRPRRARHERSEELHEQRPDLHARPPALGRRLGHRPGRDRQLCARRVHRDPERDHTCALRHGPHARAAGRPLESSTRSGRHRGTRSGS